MDNQQMAPIQPATPQYQASGGLAAQPVQTPEGVKKDMTNLIKTIVIIFVSLVAVTFIGLFIWMLIERNEAQSDVDSKIAEAVAKARDEEDQKLEKEFAERENAVVVDFVGPADYGQLSFKHPKTWSVYVAAAATDGGDFNAYFNPGQVNAVGKDTINALRVTIRNKSFDDVSAEYQKAIDKKDSGLTMSTVTIGKDKNITANRYTGKIPNTDLQGVIVTFKIRDKTAILQTDAMSFQDKFDALLETVTFNE